jgi:membrane associated rhomboid family serine protease
MKKSHDFWIPWTTFILIILQLLAFAWQWRSAQLGLLDHVISDYAFSWYRFLEHPFDQLPTLITTIFIHMNFHHLLGNTLFFFIFGPTIEKRMGHIPFGFAFVLWGVCGALLHGYFSPFSILLGASGAISGAAGAFFVLYPLKMPKYNLWWGINWIFRIPAFILIGFFFAQDILGGFRSLNPLNETLSAGGVGYLAHVGGFLAGALTMFPYIWRLKVGVPFMAPGGKKE